MESKHLHHLTDSTIYFLSLKSQNNPPRCTWLLFSLPLPPSWLLPRLAESKLKPATITALETAALSRLSLASACTSVARTTTTSSQLALEETARDATRTTTSTTELAVVSSYLALTNLGILACPMATWRAVLSATTIKCAGKKCWIGRGGLGFSLTGLCSYKERDTVDWSSCKVFMLPSTKP